MKENILLTKSIAFAIRIIKLYKFLLLNHKEYVLSKQILRSGTAIGALISESVYGQSKKDFIHKLSIAIKEANETNYWLILLFETSFINAAEFESMQMQCNELLKLLTASINTSKKNLKS
jgi:four helix bundle protein